MLCEICNKREANIKYTQVINGDKKELLVCEHCANKLGIEKINFDMPINFSNFFDDIFNDYESDFLPLLKTSNILQCDKCGMTYEEFLNKGKFGCDKCYEKFERKIEPILKRLHGEVEHTGKKYNEVISSNKTKIKKEGIKDTSPDLQEELKQAIKEERYEDAAKIRDMIKKEENK